MRLCLRPNLAFALTPRPQIVPAVTELIVAELLYLNFDSPEKPVYFYINSSGSQTPDGAPTPSTSAQALAPHAFHCSRLYVLAGTAGCQSC